VGQTLGFTIGFMVPMAKYFPLSGFLVFWGTFFLASTIVITIFKAEAITPPDEQTEGLIETYTIMWRLLRQPPIQKISLHLFTRSLAFIPADVMAPGRLQDIGFPKESLAGIKLVVTPLELVMPWILSPFTAGERPLNVILVAYVPRVLLTLLSGAAAFYIGDVTQPTPTVVYVGVFFFVVAQAVISNAMFVSHMAFFAKVSDPAIGGTYMTFLNTVHNLGNMWASTFCLKAADHIKSSTGYDGFYALCAACTVYGILWLVLFKPLLERLQELPAAKWRMLENKENKVAKSD